jgi:hypothetical protein
MQMPLEHSDAVLRGFQFTKKLPPRCFLAVRPKTLPGPPVCPRVTAGLAQVLLLVAPRAGAVDGWTTKKGPPVPLYDSSQSCAALGTDYWLLAGDAPNAPSTKLGTMMKYATTTHVWSIGTSAHRRRHRTGRIARRSCGQ